MASTLPGIALVFSLLLPALVQDEGAPAERGQVLKEGFEFPKTSWRREETDATVTIESHDRSTRAAHEGRTSERFVFDSGPGSALYFSMMVPRIPIESDPSASLYVRSNRVGVQVFGRVVLPADLDPDTGLPSFLLVPGESVTVSDRWQKLELGDVRAELDRQARVRRIGTKREVSLDGAYLEKLVLNLYGGAGATEVFVDELTLGPIPGDDAQAEANPALPEPLAAPERAQVAAPPSENAPARGIRLQGNQLMKDNVDIVPSIMDAPGADPLTLREHGFNMIKLPADAPNQAAEEAIKANLLLVPTLPNGPTMTAERMLAAAQSYPYRDHVAFWNLGDGLGAARDLDTRKERLERDRQVIAKLNEEPAGVPRLSTGTVIDFLPRYALAGRNLDMIGIEATDWATIRDPFDTYRFLAQRREMTALKNPRALFLAWVNASAPPSAVLNVWGRDRPPTWGTPQVQPEQISQQVYAALSAGYRAIGFRADADITSPGARPRLMEMAILNAEIDLVESILARGSDPIVLWPAYPPDPERLIIYNTNGGAAGANQSRSSPATRAQKEVTPHPSIRAAAIPLAEKGGRLLFVTDFAPSSQYQPPQMAVNGLKFLIQASENAQAFSITPAGIEVLQRERTTGGLQFTMKVFSGRALILVTTDLSMKARLEAKVASIAPRATEFAILQLRAQIDEAVAVHNAMADEGHTIQDANDLIAKANTLYQSAVDARERMEYALAWDEAKHGARTIRHFQWRHYIKAFDQMYRLTLRIAKAEEAAPPLPMVFTVASPPLTAFQTIPQHYRWLGWIAGGEGTFGPNLIPSGSFDLGGGKLLRDEGWTDVSHTDEDVETRLEILEKAGYGPNNSALHMTVLPKNRDPDQLADVIPYLDHEAIAVRTPPIPVHRGGLFRIRVLVRLNRQLPRATGGLIVRDSLGGKPYEVRLTDMSPKWREVVLYRFAPDDGEMTVTLGLAGYGDCYFDRLRVDTITGTSDTQPDTGPPSVDPIARRLAPPEVNPETTGPRR